MKIMKYIKAFAVALLLVGMATSCMDDDWTDPNGETLPVGNNNIAEDASKLITIKELKERTVNKLAASTTNDTIRIKEDWQLKASVTANDVQGNIYNEVAVEDESGEALIICIQKGGLYGFLPVGQEILVNLKDLYIGIYGNNVQLGAAYTNSSGRTFPSRMNFNIWNEHFRLLGVADPSKVIPEVFADSLLEDVAYIKSHRGKLMTLKNVELDVKNDTTKWAPEYDKDNGNGVSRTVVLNGKANSKLVVRSSSYADFAAAAIPRGKVNLTGVFTVYSTNPSRYGYTWQILLRTEDDVEIVK